MEIGYSIRYIIQNKLKVIDNKMETRMGLKENAREIKKNMVIIYIVVRKKETPWYAKVMATLTIGYALSPIDLIPDFIPVLGYLDDVLILPLFLYLSIKLIPEPIIKQAKLEAVDLWKDGKPKKWYYAIPIVCIWIAAVLIILSLIIR
jgi:uncharacterized membrane protein YkvA (DUF1232 family)